LTDNSVLIEHLEARVTLLERKIARLQVETDKPPEPPSAAQPKEFHFACNSPDLLIANIYPVELDPVNNVHFCWVGNDGPLQFVFPVRPISESLCRMRLAPHSAVDMHHMVIIVNDQVVSADVQTHEGMLDIAFSIPSSATSEISVVITGVASVRPSDMGESSDIRLLAARFFGAEIMFDAA
jgi:hypothetical protein